MTTTQTCYATARCIVATPWNWERHPLRQVARLALRRDRTHLAHARALRAEVIQAFSAGQTSARDLLAAHASVQRGARRLSSTATMQGHGFAWYWADEARRLVACGGRA